MGKRKGNKIDGWINFFKPAGMGSTDAVAKVRRALNAAKIGHAGTLDPLASGVLPLALGEATKTVHFAQDLQKTYSFRIIWGEARNTDDAEGAVIQTSETRPTKKEIQAILPRFTGAIAQIPPQFSAIHVNGQRAYDLARAGQNIELKPRQVVIHTLQCLDAQKDSASFRVLCGKGTYMRSLARDIAQELGTCGYIDDLVRESVGIFRLEDTISLDKLEKITDIAAAQSMLHPAEAVLDDIPALPVTTQEAARLRQGQKLTLLARHDIDRLTQAGIDIRKDHDPVTALVTLNGRGMALVQVAGPEIKPVRILNIQD